MPMKIKHFLYNSFLIENGKNKIAIDPGQNLWIFNLISLIPKSEWKSITHILITHGCSPSDKVGKVGCLS